MTAAAFATLDPDGRIVAWSPAAEALLGWQRREVLYRDAAEMLLPRRLEDEFDAALAALRAGDHRGARVRYAVRASDGEERELELTVGVVDVDGHPHFAVWAVNASDLPLLPRASLQAAAFEHAAAAMAVVASDGTYLEVNGATARLLRRDLGILHGSDARRYIHPADLAAVLSAARRVRTGAARTAALDARLMLPGGGFAWARLTVASAHGAGPDALVITAEDVTARRSAEQQLAGIARRLEDAEALDPLTGLLAAERFVGALEDRLAEPADAALLVVELDLPAVPVEHRPAELDLLLGRVASPFAALWLAGEPVGRVAWDRLAAVYTLHDPEHMTGLARHAEETIRAVDPRVRVRAVAVRPRAGDDAADVMTRAEEALIEATAESEAAAVDPRIEQLLGYAREHLGVEVTVLSSVADDALRSESVSGPADAFGLAVGDVTAVDESICGPLLDGRTGPIVDTLTHPATRALPPTGRGVRTYLGVPLHLPDGSLYGTLCALDASRRADRLDERDVSFMRFLAQMIGEMLAADRSRAEAAQASRELTGVAALMATLEARDQYTSDHSHAVVELAFAVGRRLGLSEDELLAVRQVAILHDIGKVGMPDAVLQKPGPLDPDEWALMRQHPAIGARIVGGIPGLAHLAPAIRAEHERWDGTGYPDGLAGDAIPLASRIVLACDAVHAMTSDRPYRPALPTHHMRAELLGGAGTQFAPAVVDAVLAELQR